VNKGLGFVRLRTQPDRGEEAAGLYGLERREPENLVCMGEHHLVDGSESAVGVGDYKHPEPLLAEFVLEAAQN